jgi:cytochrome c-type biogenesis protein CcmH
MKSRVAFFALLFLVLNLAFLAATPGPVFAQQPTPSDDDVNSVARQLYCPVCENTPLDVCPTEACRQWRDLIRQMLAEGKTETEIEKYFVENYGARVLSEPPRTGLNWLVYIVPPVAFLAGVFLLFQAFRTWKRAAQTSNADSGSGSEPAPAASDDYVARLEAELKKRK